MISVILFFVCGSREGSEGAYLYLHAAWRTKQPVFSSHGSSGVFFLVLIIIRQFRLRGPNKGTLSKKNSIYNSNELFAHSMI